jgi:SAM-dependent methyltransferase
MVVKMKTRYLRVSEHLVLAEHRIKVAAIKLAAKLGWKKYREMTDGPTTIMTNDRIPRRFVRLYSGPEEAAIRSWMQRKPGASYLDVGAGSGRFAKMALENGACNVTAVDIADSCVSALNAISGIRALKMDARKLDFPDSSFDRVMMLGNALANTYLPLWYGGEHDNQLQILRELYRVTRSEVCLTLQRPESMRIVLQYYRMNHLELYEYDHKIGIKRLHVFDESGTKSEFRSQHFREQDVDSILQEAGILISQYSIIPINHCNWLVIIRKGGGEE